MHYAFKSLGFPTELTNKGIVTFCIYFDHMPRGLVMHSCQMD